MIVAIMKIKDYANNETKYLTYNQFKDEREPFISHMIDVKIPDRFSPNAIMGETRKDDHIIVQCDGTGYLLEEVLGTDTQGNPAIVWEDSKYRYLHRVRLEVVE